MDDDATFPDFKNKLLTIHLVGGSHNYVVSNPVFQKNGGRWFVVGNTPKGSSAGDWSENIEVAIAWDQVSAYRVFDSVEQYIQRYEKFRAVGKNA